MRPPGVGLSFTHMRMNKLCTIDNLAAMEHDLDDALSGLLPARNDVDVICYNCTSGSFVIGEDVITHKLERAHPGVTGTTLLSGVTSALRAFNAHTLSVGTAYTRDINELEREYFESRGFRIAVMEGLGLTTDVEMNQVSPRFLNDFALSIDRPETDAVFLSCGALRSLEILEDAEREIGKPVIASNQASFWHCLRLAGVEDRLTGFGSLLRAF